MTPTLPVNPFNPPQASLELQIDADVFVREAMYAWEKSVGLEKAIKECGSIAVANQFYAVLSHAGEFMVHLVPKAWVTHQGDILPEKLYLEPLLPAWAYNEESFWDLRPCGFETEFDLMCDLTRRGFEFNEELQKEKAPDALLRAQPLFMLKREWAEMNVMTKDILSDKEGDSQCPLSAKKQRSL